jgi:hypothetical protein
MQDLFQNYVDDLRKLREALDSELVGSAKELTKAMGAYVRESETALSSFMEKVAARGAALEAAASARFDRFRGLPENRVQKDDNAVAPEDTLTDADQAKIVAAAERAVANSLQLDSEGDRKPPRSIPPISLVKSEPAA